MADTRKTNGSLNEMGNAVPGKGKPEAARPGDPVVVLPDTPLVKSATEPVIIEVVFRQKASPEDLRLAASLPPDAQPADSANLVSASLRNILQRYELQHVERSFRNLEDVEHSDSEVAGDPALKYGRENFIRLFFPPGAESAQISQELNELPEVEWAARVPKALPPASPRDEPLVGKTDQVAAGQKNQWYIFRCHADYAWDIGLSGVGVVIADIDFGCCVDHEDLKTRIKLTHNSVDGKEDVSHGEQVSHGTAVLGLAGAAVNGLGIAGIAYGATLWAIQANQGGEPPIEGDPWANAIDFVRDAESGGMRKVIILEHETDLGENCEVVWSIRRAIKDAIERKVVVCVTAGNGKQNAGYTEAGVEIPETNSILVGATIFHPSLNARWEDSNFGRRIVVSAPGDLEFDLTCSCFKDDPYRKGFGGTSGAAAKVAGAVALMLEANPALSHDEVRDILMSTGTSVATSASLAMGSFLNVEKAVKEAIKRKGNHLLMNSIRGNEKRITG